jgi:hypothetical protein
MNPNTVLQDGKQGLGLRGKKRTINIGDHEIHTRIMQHFKDPTLTNINIPHVSQRIQTIPQKEIT